MISIIVAWPKNQRNGLCVYCTCGKDHTEWLSEQNGECEKARTNKLNLTYFIFMYEYLISSEVMVNHPLGVVSSAYGWICRFGCCCSRSLSPPWLLRCSVTFIFSFWQSIFLPTFCCQCGVECVRALTHSLAHTFCANNNDRISCTIRSLPAHGHARPIYGGSLF